MKKPSSQLSVADQKQIACGNCHTPNSADRKFCAQCGTVLWEPCLECGQQTPVDVEFCGACGQSTFELHAQRKKSIQSAFEAAESLRQQGRYRSAISTLRSISSGGDSRLQPFEIDARKLLDSLAIERVDRESAAMSIGEEAKVCVESKDYRRALALLTSIPPGLRSTDTEHLLTQVNAVLDEMSGLEDEIRTLWRAKDWDALLPRVLHLLELQPNDEKLIKIADQLTTRQRQKDHSDAVAKLSRAAAQLASHRYEQAALELRGIDGSLLTEAQQQQQHLAMELHWLVTLLKTSPFYFPDLIRIAQRLKQLKPDDPRLPRVAKALQQRQAVLQTQGSAAVTWVANQSESAVGVPVEWWNGISQYDVATEADSVRTHASQYKVALGLALQGLGEAKLDFNLLPTQANQSLAGRLSALRGRPRKSCSWGIDIGHAGVRAVMLRRESSDAAIEITQSIQLEFKEAESSDRQADSVAEKIGEILEQIDPRKSNIVLGIPGHLCLIRDFDVPQFDPKKMSEIIKYEVQAQIPLPSDSVVYDWHRWNHQDEERRLERVTLVAARLDHVRDRLAAFASAGMRPTSVQSDCVAIYNAAMLEFADRIPRQPRQGLAVLDIGVERSQLTYVAHDHLQFRAIPLGTQHFSRCLMQSLQWTKPRADEIRSAPLCADWIYQLEEVLTPVYSQLVDAIRRTFNAYRQDEREVTQLIVTGGGSHQLGLLRFLTRGPVWPAETA